jgi:hypothetical protein
MTKWSENLRHIYNFSVSDRGMRWRSGWGTALQIGRSRVQFPMLSHNWHNSSCRTMALGSTQPLTEMSTRNISWGKGGRCAGLTTLPPSCADCLNSGSLNLLEPSGPVKACNGIALPSVSDQQWVSYARGVKQDNGRRLKQRLRTVC